MPKLQGTMTVHPPACGHKGPFTVAINKNTGEAVGTCAQCNGPVKVDVVVENPGPKN